MLIILNEFNEVQVAYNLLNLFKHSAKADKIEVPNYHIKHKQPGYN